MNALYFYNRLLENVAIVKSLEFNQLLDYATPYIYLDKIQIPTRSELNKSNLIEGCNVKFYTHDSKRNCEVESGIFFEDFLYQMNVGQS